MAGESRETGTVTVSLPSELEAWVDEQAADLGVDRETLLLQLLSSYRATANGEDLAVAEDLDEAVSRSELEPIIKDILTDRLPDLKDAVAERVAEDLREEGDDLVSEEFREEIATEIEERVRGEFDPDALEGRVDDLEADYREKLQDVRERVIQVKRDTDAKASVEAVEEMDERIEDVADSVDDVDQRVQRHDDRLSDVAADVDAVESELAALEERLDDADVEGTSEGLEDAREKLQTVAYVVRDLRKQLQDDHGAETVERIKRQAASADITRAACENCGNGVEIGLLTEPSCPHCEATLDGVEKSKRLFGLGNPTLTVASGLESGADGTDEMDQISTKREGERR
jgi:predicted Zn-ribbon and HTH transcriptional regulator